jgi:hypothetical protein
MTSKSMDASFKQEIVDNIPDKLLQIALDWIRDNMKPAEVFPESAMVSHIQDSLFPEQVFSKKELTRWAEEHLLGYTSPDLHAALEQEPDYSQPILFTDFHGSIIVSHVD